MEEQSLRGFLDFVERRHPGHLLRIKEPIRRELDITSSVFELERAGHNPVLVFEQVEGSSMPVVTNVAGSRALLAAHPCESPLPAALR